MKIQALFTHWDSLYKREIVWRPSITNARIKSQLISFHQKKRFTLFLLNRFVKPKTRPWPHNQWLADCKHGSGNILDARQLPCNLKIFHGQSQHCIQRRFCKQIFQNQVQSLFLIRFMKLRKINLIDVPYMVMHKIEATKDILFSNFFEQALHQITCTHGDNHWSLYLAQLVNFSNFHRQYLDSLYL